MRFLATENAPFDISTNVLGKGAFQTISHSPQATIWPHVMFFRFLTLIIWLVALYMLLASITIRIFCMGIFYFIF